MNTENQLHRLLLRLLSPHQTRHQKKTKAIEEVNCAAGKNSATSSSVTPKRANIPNATDRTLPSNIILPVEESLVRLQIDFDYKATKRSKKSKSVGKGNTLMFTIRRFPVEEALGRLQMELDYKTPKNKKSQSAGKGKPLLAKWRSPQMPRPTRIPRYSDTTSPNVRASKASSLCTVPSTTPPSHSRGRQSNQFHKLFREEFGTTTPETTPSKEEANNTDAEADQYACQHESGSITTQTMFDYILNEVVDAGVESRMVEKADDSLIVVVSPGLLEIIVDKKEADSIRMEDHISLGRVVSFEESSSEQETLEITPTGSPIDGGKEYAPSFLEEDYILEKQSQGANIRCSLISDQTTQTRIEEKNPKKPLLVLLFALTLFGVGFLLGRVYQHGSHLHGHTATPMVLFNQTEIPTTLLFGTTDRAIHQCPAPALDEKENASAIPVQDEKWNPNSHRQDFSFASTSKPSIDGWVHQQAGLEPTIFVKAIDRGHSTKVQNPVLKWLKRLLPRRKGKKHRRQKRENKFLAIFRRRKKKSD